MAGMRQILIISFCWHNSLRKDIYLCRDINCVIKTGLFLSQRNFANSSIIYESRSNARVRHTIASQRHTLQTWFMCMTRFWTNEATRAELAFFPRLFLEVTSPENIILDLHATLNPSRPCIPRYITRLRPIEIHIPFMYRHFWSGSQRGIPLIFLSICLSGIPMNVASFFMAHCAWWRTSLIY